MQQRTWKRIGIGVLIAACAVLAVRVIFDEKFDDFDRMMEARENHPGGVEEFDRNFAAMAEWLKQYKRDNPGATDDDASAAYDAAWGE